MGKQDDRRRALLAPMADHILKDGLAGASLRALAAAAGTSDRMLLYYFDDKDSLVAATLRHIGAGLAAGLDAAVGGAAPQPFATLLAQIWHVFGDPAFAPYVRLWLDLAARAAAGDRLAAEVGRDIADTFANWVAARLDTPDPDDRMAQASLLLATVDGMALLDAVGHRGDLSRALQSLAR